VQIVQKKHYPQALARQTQLFIVTGITLITAGIFVIPSLLSPYLGSSSTSEALDTHPARTPGMFRPTEAQWELLKIVPVQLMKFRNERTSEGKNSNDEGVTAPAVPEESVVYDGETARVWIAGTDKTLGLRQIRTGRTQDGMVEVLGGLQTGEPVVSNGSLLIDRAAESQ
jgi:hypothetical protein